MPVLYLCRHAESVANVERWISGWEDVGLTPRGLSQSKDLAEAIAKVEDVQGILSSDLSRARLTAEFIADRMELPLVLDRGLRERNYGEWTGIPYYQIPPEYRVSWEEIRFNEEFCPPGGESLGQQRARLIRAIDRGRKRWREGFIVVSHKGSLILLSSHFAGVDPGEAETPPDPPGYMRVVVDGTERGRNRIEYYPH